ncbi:uncharacterized protein LOC135483643 isoform X4 [Lineus longissimus]|uniref:uncharacterized protein LOC135483643 isoform X4 n=1 Tax=Lineus longissimus TaxID=88925 RepID=UPI002B4DE32E
MPHNFGGKWKPVVNDGVEELFGKLGVSSIKISAAKGGEQAITQTGDNLEHVKVVTTAAVVFKKTSEYTVGVPFEDKDPADNVWKCNASWEGDSLVVNAECEKKNFKQVITRKMEGAEMVMTYELTAPDGNLKCTRRFQKKD